MIDPNQQPNHGPKPLDTTTRRWNAFKKEKLSLMALGILTLLCCISFTAELWANNKPVYMRFNGQSFFPAFRKYHPSEFGEPEDVVYADYRKIAEKAEFVLWPVIRWSPYESNNSLSRYPAEPTKQNLFGTDDRGRDVLSRLIYGFRYSMLYALSVWILASLVAIIFGGLMGYFGGWVDLTLQRITEVMETIPTLMLLLILVSIFKPSIVMLVMISFIFGWMGLAHYTRAEFLRLRKLPFVEFARAQGTSHLRIIYLHILPNALTPFITFAPFAIAGSIYGLSALDYLGFGLPPPTPSWGEMLSQAKANVTIAWWLAVFPSIALFVTLMLLTFLGNGLRRAFDPRSNG